MKTRLTVGLGEVLVRRGAITAAQLETLLQHQQEHRRPLGELAETLLGVAPREVESAWAEQYLAMDASVDLDRTVFDPFVAETLSRRQAWQFEVLPLHRRDGYLIIATSAERLARAVPFAWSQFNEPVLVMVAQRSQLRAHLARIYPWPTMRRLDPHAVARLATIRLRIKSRARMAADAQAAPKPTASSTVPASRKTVEA